MPNFQLGPVDEIENSEAYNLKDFVPEGYPEEKVSGLAAAIDTYVTVFSKPPFDEKFEVSNLPEGYSQYDLFYDLLTEDTTAAPNDQGGETLEINTPDIYATISTSYPLKDIVESYVRESIDPKSMVLVRAMLKNGKKELIDLSDNQTLPSRDEVDYAMEAARVRYCPDPETAREETVEEIKGYLSEEDAKDLLNRISKTDILYLAEIASKNENDRFSLGVMRKYWDKLKDEDTFRELPGYLIYFTKKGTKTEGVVFTRILNRYYNRRDTELILDYVEYTDVNRPDENILVYILKANPIK